MSNHYSKEEILGRLNIEDFYRSELPRLKRPNASGEALAICPFHDDKEPSLSVNVHSGLFHCHACQTSGDVFSFVQQRYGLDFPQALELLAGHVGLSPKAPNPTHRKVAEYDYCDENGELLSQVERFEPKSFRQRRLLPTGKWEYSVKGVRHVPYHLPEVLAAQQVFIVEGEKDADRLAALGLVATCNAGGAGKWKEEFSQYLKGKDVIILPDNDQAGFDHAEKVARLLSGHAGSIKLVNLPNLPPKGDVSDWLAMGGSKDELLRLCAMTDKWQEPSAASTRIPIITLRELAAMELSSNPLIEGFLDEEESLLLVGPCGIGKSLLTLNLALEIGSPASTSLWGVFPIARPLRSLFVQAENAPKALLNRNSLMTNEAPSHNLAFDNVCFAKGVMACGSLERHDFISMLREWLDFSKADVLILDPLISYAGVDENDNAKMRRSLDALTSVASEFGAATIVVHHPGRVGSRSRGASAIDDWAANIVQIEQVKGGARQSLRLRNTKARNRELFPDVILERTPGLNFKASSQIAGRQGERLQAVVLALLELGGSVESQAQLRNKLMEILKISRSQAAAMIKEAEEAGLIVSSASRRGSAKSYYLPGQRAEVSRVHRVQ